MRNSIHQSGLDYAALVTERERKSEEGRAGRVGVSKYVRDGSEGGPNRGREKLALEYLKARRGGGRGNEMGANAAEEQREALRKRGNALGIQVLMTRHRASARSSNEEGGRSNAPRWRWLKAGCLSSFHLCLVASEALSHIFPAEARLPRPTPRCTSHRKPRSGSSPRSFCFL